MSEWTPSEVLIDEPRQASATPVYQDGRYVVQTTPGEEVYTVAGIDVDALQEAMQKAADGIVRVFSAYQNVLKIAAEKVVDWALSAGLIESPHTSYRHTRYGRVPRLTPELRERQRELRRAGGRR